MDENSIAWKVALKAHEEGAKFILTNAPVALRMGEINKLAEKCDTIVISADPLGGTLLCYPAASRGNRKISASSSRVFDDVSR